MRLTNSDQAGPSLDATGIPPKVRPRFLQKAKRVRLQSAPSCDRPVTTCPSPRSLRFQAGSRERPGPRPGRLNGPACWAALPVPKNVVKLACRPAKSILPSLGSAAMKTVHLTTSFMSRPCSLRIACTLFRMLAGLRLGVAVVRGSALGRVGRGHRAGQLAADVQRVTRPDGRRNGRFLRLDVLDRHLRLHGKGRVKKTTPPKIMCFQLICISFNTCEN